MNDSPDPYPYPIPSPTPEHQHRITRQKWFEVIVVVALIAFGAGYLGWREYRSRHQPDAAVTLVASVAALEKAGARSTGQTTVLGRQWHSLAQSQDGFDRRIELIGKEAAAPLETAIVSLWLNSGSAALAPQALQQAVNGAGEAAQRLVASSADALDKAVHTMTSVNDGPRPHDRGVAVSGDGWKLTYVTYHTVADSGPAQPALYLVLQRLSAGSDPKLSEFNRVLYESIQHGDDIRSALLPAPPSAR